MQIFRELPLQEVTYACDEHSLNGHEVNTLTPEIVLQRFFGYASFRPGQLKGVNAVLRKQDAIILIPTGGGKTVIYAVPTLMLPGITVVVSPLLMLMHGQLLHLREKGINTCYINSMLSGDERETVVANLSRKDCGYKILTVSLEILLKPSIENLLQKLSNDKRLNFFAIDEAHCIDTWGSDLRPEYQELGVLKQYAVPVVALTATATSVTVDLIKQTLNMQNPVVISVPFYRSNLKFEILEKKT